jgi:hypothetical protein
MSEKSSQNGTFFAESFVYGFSEQNADVAEILFVGKVINRTDTTEALGHIDCAVRVKTKCTLRELLSASARCSANIVFEAGDEIYFELTSASGETWVTLKQNEKRSDEKKYEKKLKFYEYYFNTLHTSSDALPPRRYVILVYNGRDFAQMGDYWNGSTYGLTTAHVYFSNKLCNHWQQTVQLERSERRVDEADRRAAEALRRVEEETRRAAEADRRAAEALIRAAKAEQEVTALKALLAGR